MASPMQWTWTWTNIGRWWGTGRPGVLQAMGLQRVRPKWVTEHTAKKNLNDICTSEIGMRPEGSTGSWKGVMNTPLPDRKAATLSFVPRNQEDWPLWSFQNRTPKLHLSFQHTCSHSMYMAQHVWKQSHTSQQHAAQASAKIFLLLLKLSPIPGSFWNINSDTRVSKQLSST